MLTLEQALDHLLASVQPVADDARIPVHAAVGRYLSEPVLAPHALPLFDNSAMDGWAVRSSDGAGPLRSIAHIPAGQFFAGEIRAGECARIFTGSPLPRGADAVAMQEDARVNEAGGVSLLEPVKPWENVRFRGEDVKESATIAERGQKVTAPLASLFMACGVGEINVHRTIRVAVLATGNELREPGEVLQLGEIHESNRVLVASMLRDIGAEPVLFPIVPDDFNSTVAALRSASECDAVITCGGVSVGEHDFVKGAIESLGGRVDFWRVAIKPGKPFAHATISGKPLFGLPGNPVSTQVTLLLLARPALLKMSGAGDFSPTVSFGELAEPISNRGDRRHFVRVSLDSNGLVRTSGPQASHRLASLARANGLLDVPAETDWEAGRKVKVLLFG